MLAAIPKKFRLIEIELNHANSFNLPLKQRDNYILDLRKPYENLYAAYSENLQRNIKKSVSQGVRYSADVPVQEVLQLAKIQMEGFAGYSDVDFVNFGKLFSFLHARGQALACGVYSGNNELTASAVFFFSHQRAYYILVGNRVDKRTDGASHYLIDRFIETHAGKQLWLDFEGSDIAGLAKFYSSFGAIVEKYPSLRVNHLPWIVKVLSSKF